MKKNASGNGSIRKKQLIRNGKTYTYWEARYSYTDTATGKTVQRSVSAPTQSEARIKLTKAL